MIPTLSNEQLTELVVKLLKRVQALEDYQEE